MTMRLSIASIILMFSVTPDVLSSEIEGYYLEARTCQVYTGPCFANGESGIAGKDAVMAWSIKSGTLGGVGLSGLKVAVVVRATDTLGFEGLVGARDVKSMVLVDDSANVHQREALVQFVREKAGKAGKHVLSVRSAPISFEFDEVNLIASVNADRFVALSTRKARPGDCICSNESAYYPPLAQLEGFVPGVTISGRVKGRDLGTSWSIPDSRTSYMGTFRY